MGSKDKKESLPGPVETAGLATQGIYEDLVELFAIPGEITHAILSSFGLEYESPTEAGKRILLENQGLMPYETEPGTIRHAIKEGAGFAAPGLGTLGVVGRLPKATSFLGKALIRPIQEAPAFEAALSVGSGAGAAAAGAAFPKSEVAAPLLGALAGGLGTALARPLGAAQPLRFEVTKPLRRPAGETRLAPAKPNIMKETGEVVFDEASAQGLMGTLVRDYEKRLEQGIHPALIRALDEIAIDAGFVRDKNRLLSDQMLEWMQHPSFPKQRFGAIMEANNLTTKNLWELMRFDVKRGARAMGQLSWFSRQLNQYMRDPELRDVLDGLGGPNSRGMNFWRRLENQRRALLVTQMATAMRNGLTQVGRLGLDLLQQGMDNAILRFFPDYIRAEHPTNAFAAITRLVSSPRLNKEQVAELTRQLKTINSDAMDPLFYRFTSDLSQAGAGAGAWNKVERGIQLLNTANRFQEFSIRRAVFTAEMDRLLSRDGLDLADILARGDPDGLPQEYIEQSVRKALDMTWAKEYSPFGPGFEGVAGKGIQFINSLGIGPFRATILIPFPRFMANAVEFQYEHSPLPLIKLAYSKKEWAKVAAGDVSTISKGTFGTAMFLAAYQFRNSEYAGERWYEIRNPRTGEMIDARAYNPFVGYLFAAELVKRGIVNTNLPMLTAREILQGFIGVQIRAGAGLHVADKMLEGMSSLAGSREEAIRSGKEMAGEFLGSFLVPLQQLRDLVAQFDESQRVIRDRRAAPFLGPIATKLPYGSDLLGLPEVQLPTREAPPRMVDPLVRQLTGLSFKEPRNPAERELARLKFDRLEILPSSGVPEWDRAVAEEMGPSVEHVMSEFVRTPEYKSLPEEEKAYTLWRELGYAREEAREQAGRKHPGLWIDQNYKGKSKRQRRAAEAAIRRGDYDRAKEILGKKDLVRGR